MKKPSKHYVDNKKFLEVIKTYQKACRKAKREKLPKPPIPNYLGECLMKIAQHYAYMPSYSRYSFLEEMMGDAIENCIMYFDNFDPKKSSNPFAYFTQITYYAFLRRIAKEKKSQYLKYKVMENSVLFADPNQYGIDENDVLDSSSNLKPFEIYDNIREFTHNFEQKQVEKKNKAASKKEKKGLENFYDEE